MILEVLYVAFVYIFDDARRELGDRKYCAMAR